MIVREVQPNGLTLVTESMPHVRSAAVGVWLRRGSRHESLAKMGISHFIEHMVFKGTATRSAAEIASEVDAIGGYMDAYTAKEHAAFHLKVLDEHLPRAVDIVGDIVRNPLFDETEIEKEKQVILEEIHMVEDTPDDLVMELFSGAFWADHPLGRPILGTRRHVLSFTRAQLARFFREVYHPGNLIVAAAGRLEHETIREWVAASFGELKQGTNGRRDKAPQPQAKIITRSKRELEQVHLCVGVPAHCHDHPDRYAAHVLNVILGGGMSSRLFQHVREERGLVYSISSGIASYSDAGNLCIYAGTSRRQIDDVLSLTVDELRRLEDEPVDPAELRRAKDHLKGSFILSLEGSGSRMSHLARQELALGSQLKMDSMLESIERVQSADVLRVARELFGGPMTVSVLGDLRGYRPRASRLRVRA
jgi:predicted Zn-dependent peptidase